MDKIIFPNGIEKIFRVVFPNGEVLLDMEMLECTMCNEKFIAGKVFDQHEEWAKLMPSNVYEPQSIADFLHRECPMCHNTGRIRKAIGNTGGGFMPNASETMKLYVNGEEVAEMQKAGDVIVTITGPGEIVEFDSRLKKNADGTPQKEKKIQICVDMGEGEERFWTPNATTMRAMIAKYGQATEEWNGKKIKLEATKQNVSGQMKLVVYGTPAE